jgi:hypothetical protein
VACGVSGRKRDRLGAGCRELRDRLVGAAVLATHDRLHPGVDMGAAVVEPPPPGVQQRGTIVACDGQRGEPVGESGLDAAVRIELT